MEDPLASIDERRECHKDGVCASGLHYCLASFLDNVDDRIGHGVDTAAAADIKVGFALGQQVSALREEGVNMRRQA